MKTTTGEITAKLDVPTGNLHVDEFGNVAIGAKRKDAWGASRSLLGFIDVKGQDDCWNWRGTKSTWIGRRGKMSIGGRTCLAYRLVFNLMFGKIGKEMCICHHCDNPTCVNPNHLFEGTQTDNVHDCRKKGRNPSFGEGNWEAKLSTSEALEIKRLRKESNLSFKQLAEKFNVPYQVVYNCGIGRTWRHLQ